MSILKQLSLLLMTILISWTSFSQSIKGKIIDEEGSPIPYASIYIKEMTMGTSSNELGDFEVRLNSGNYTVAFHHLSYETYTQNIKVPLDSPLLIKLKTKSYDLPEAQVDSKREDPAYAMIRKAIGMAPFYNQQLSYYKAEVYIKGAVKIEKISGLVKMASRKELKQLNIKEGEKYLQESVNEITYRDGKFTQRVISESNTFPPQMDAANKLRFTSANYNIYSPDNTTIISPLSTQSFSYYRFRYEGFSKEGDRIINKIKVTPKNNNKMAWQGYLYLADDLWYVYRFELSSESMGVHFTINQHYGEIAENIWVPVSNNMDVKLAIMGNKGSGTYVNSVKYIDFKINPLKTKQLATISTPQSANVSSNIAKQKTTSAKSDKLQQQIIQLAAKENMTNSDAFKMSRLMQKKEKEDLKNLPDSIAKKTSLNLSDNYKFETDSMAHKRDSSYWSSIRPIPLPLDEVKSYQRADSIKLIYAKEKTDSTLANRKQSFKGVMHGLLLGKTFYLSDSSLNIRYNGFFDLEELNFLNFNTVDGYSYQQHMSITKRFKDTTRLRINLQGGYAFARKKALFQSNISYQYWPEKQAIISIGTTYQSQDFNRDSGNPNFDNMIWTLFARQNYIHYFEDASIFAEHIIEPINGFKTSVQLSHHRQNKLQNNSDYSFFFRNSRTFSSNDPINSHITGLPDLLNDNRSTVIQIELSYTPQMRYIQRRRTKYNVGSPYPTFSLIWKKGIPNLLGSSSNFDLLETSIKQTVKMGLMQSFQYGLTGGWFPNNNRMHFSELKHFDSKPYFFSFVNYDKSYGLVPIYSLSERKWYTTANAMYRTPFLLLKYLPLLNNSNILENISISYFRSHLVDNYIELGYGLNNILLMGEAKLLVGFDNFSYSTIGIRFSFNLTNR